MRKLKILVLGAICIFVFSLLKMVHSLNKFNIVGSLVRDSYVDLPVYLSVHRLSAYIGSDFITFNFLDFIIPGVIYKFMSMLDLKREDWERRNQLLLGSVTPQYGVITGRVILITACWYIY